VLDEIVKAVRVEPNQYVQVEREEIEDIELETSHTIDIVKFVPQIEIDDLYYDKPYYIVPDGEIGQEAFAVIRAALDEKGMAGIGRVVFSRRERSIVLKPYCTTGMTGVTLRYPYQLRDARSSLTRSRSRRSKRRRCSSRTSSYAHALKKSVREAAAGSTAQRKPQPVARPSRKPSGAPSRVRRTG
jgi:Ku protein